MANANFSFIILTLNEEIHLIRLLDSIVGLNARTFVLDSGSTDRTLTICKERGIEVKYNKFQNHPKQWDFALKNFNIDSPWTIGLDADQVVSHELYRNLRNFEPNAFTDIDGVYFNRKYYFRKKWIKHGGYYPMYLLKMFRTNIGYSDLSENMDHRFQVPGKTITWSKGYIIEENYKENTIAFWIEKHNIYSDLIADEEFAQSLSKIKITWRKGIFGSPNERKKWKKQIWLHLPLFIRPWLFIFYRLIIKLGIVDGTKGILFHFLQSFWFRLIVDVKIDERVQQNQITSPSKSFDVLKFFSKFVMLCFIFYYFNILFISICSPGGYYLPYFEEHLNYIKTLRQAYISCTAFILEYMGFKVLVSSFGLTVLNHAGFKLVFSCLGYGIISCFSAFALSLPKPFRLRYLFLLAGIVSIIILNICRLVIVAIYYKPGFRFIGLDHHDTFNIITYALILVCSYLYLNYFTYEKKTCPNEITKRL